MYFPFLGRLSITDYIIVVLVYIESIISSVLKLIPQPMINLFEWLIDFSTSSDDNTIEEKLRSAPTIHEMCAIFDISVEDHLVRTEDNYILTLHRIPPISKNRFNNKVVYLHHGLLMCSDVWCCNIERHKNLPFVLHDLGYDVWMGNNRGNKYSTAHLNKPPKSNNFWDFSIDEFAFFDIPNSIEFILDITKVDKVICIGFSQGSAQMFAAFSLSEKLNRKVSHFIAIAPAMTPKGLHNRIVDTLAKSSPGFMYLFFGRKIVLPSAVIWQRTLHPTLFNLCIDIANKILFNWKSFNILPRQKIASYAKLYSTTSVKSIVHWFQILRSQKFQMFEESDNMLNSLTRPYQIANFPTRTNIKIPILLIYGGIDSLVDIDVMKKNLPFNSVFDVKVDNYEHLDLIWGKDADILVIAKVLRFIEFFNPGNVSVKTNQLLPSASLVEELPSTTWKTTHPTHGLSYRTHSADRSPLSVQADEADEVHNADNSRFLRRVFSTGAIDEDNENEHQDDTEDEIHKEQQRRLSAYLESSKDLRQLDANSSTTALDALNKE
ncbi:Tgl1p [Saccharomyces cerevisiae YJM1342]|nr:Tgl1p [Saccharomyces cerevisiae YJM1342]